MQCQDINAIQEVSVMKKQRIISAIISAAMLVSSAAAAVYASAADISAPEEKISGTLADAIENSSDRDGGTFPIIVHISDNIDRAALRAKAEADTEAYIQSQNTEGMTEEEINALRTQYCDELYLSYLIEAVNKNRAPLSKYRIEWESAEGYSWENTVAGNASAEDIAELAKEDIVASIELRGDIAVPVPTGADELKKDIQPIVLCDELRDFVNSGTGSRIVTIRVSPEAENKVYEEAEAYADAQMESIGEYMSNEAMYNDYRYHLLHNYLMEHLADINREAIKTFAEKYGLTVIAQDDTSAKLTAEVTAEQLKTMLDDENVLAVLPGDSTEESPQSPTQPILAPPPGETEEPFKDVQPIVLCDELRDFIKSGSGSRSVTIRVVSGTDNKVYEDAEAYADAQMESIAEYMSNETMYNDYRSKYVHSYLMDHMADINKEAIKTFAEKYGLTVIAQDNEAAKLTAEVTAAQLKTMLDDELVIAVAPAEDVEPATPGPTTPTISAPVITIRNSLPGDANLDNKITVSDAVTVLQFLANQNKYPLTDAAKINADVDGIKGITGGDAIAIQKIDAGIIPSASENLTGSNFSTPQELINILVSEDENFSGSGFIYAPYLKYDALIADSEHAYLIVYGPSAPDYEKSIHDDLFVNVGWDTFFPHGMEKHINTKDYETSMTGDCFSGASISITPRDTAALRLGENCKVNVVFFIQGMPIGNIPSVWDGSESWTVEDFKNHLSGKTPSIPEVPTQSIN